jgi:hypothetical protein
METPKPQERQGEENAVEPAEKKQRRWVWVIVAVAALLLVVAFCFWVLVGPAIGNVFNTVQNAI